MTPDLVFRDPYLLAFLELERFLLELGTDFSFIAKQKRMTNWRPGLLPRSALLPPQPARGHTAGAKATGRGVCRERREDGCRGGQAEGQGEEGGGAGLVIEVYENLISIIQNVVSASRILAPMPTASSMR